MHLKNFAKTVFLSLVFFLGIRSYSTATERIVLEKEELHEESSQLSKIQKVKDEWKKLPYEMWARIDEYLPIHYQVYENKNNKKIENLQPFKCYSRNYEEIVQEYFVERKIRFDYKEHNCESEKCNIAYKRNFMKTMKRHLKSKVNYIDTLTIPIDFYDESVMNLLTGHDIDILLDLGNYIINTNSHGRYGKGNKKNIQGLKERLERNKNLKLPSKLRLSDVSEVQLERLSKDMKYVEILSLDNYYGRHGKSKKIWKNENFPALKYLEINYFGEIIDKDIKDIAEGLPDLFMLKINTSYISQEEVEEIAVKKLKVFNKLLLSYKSEVIIHN